MGVQIALLRGLRGRCPRCGAGRMFRGYLRLIDACPACGEPLGRIRADDGPAFFAMFAAGLLCVPLGLALNAWTALAAEALAAILVAAVPLFTLALLPRAKGVLVAVMWRHGLDGDDGG